MARMAFVCSGVGIKGLSRSSAFFGFDRGGMFYVYTVSCWGAITGATDIVSEAFEIPDKDLPWSLERLIICFELEGTVLLSANVKMKFEIFAKHENSPIYTVERRPSVSGIGYGDIKIPAEPLARIHCSNDFEVGMNIQSLMPLSESLGFLDKKGVHNYHPGACF